MEELLRILMPYADLAAVPVIVALTQLAKTSGIAFLDWGKLNALHPLWMATAWYSIRQFGLFMPIDLTWPLFILGIIATALLAIGGHSAVKNIKQWIAKNGG